MKRGKKYLEAVGTLDREALLGMTEAIAKVKELAFAKFDETVEVAVKLNVKKSQTVRDTLVLPNQFGEGKKILVFAKDEKADEAREAGATYVGDTDLVEKIKEGWVDFDVAVATPDMMKEVGKLGPILGRRGLMPNPKTQTVTFEIKEALAELQKGRVEFRSDKTGVVHLAVGKVSMEADQIRENAQAFVDEVMKKKPTDIKGDFVKSVSISSTMGPGIKIDLKRNGDGEQ
ncbi:MAG: 50S ribosomal protein L1 [Spirochaetales bacterium]|nr:50S ribosomal protein L1 [Spirochaetales bacterium]MCF7937775.1 50S ribosomal protein L1 [Spirochaetales bacterium]